MDDVKEVVERQLGELSPDARVVRTGYFNHTYMPDLVLEWGDRARDSRPIFIRNHIDEASAAAELGSLSHSEGVVVPLDPIEPTSGENDAVAETGELTVRASASERAPRLLVADSTGLAQMSHELDEARSKSPLLSLVGRNLLRGGRGVLTDNDVVRVSTAAQLDLQGGEAAVRLAEFDAITTEFFNEPAALRLQRAADIVRIAVTADAETAVISDATGVLSDAELRVLLPYLLDLPAGRVGRNFWAFLGAMMELERLEDLSEVVADRDVSALVRANAQTWTAKRAQLVFNADYDEEDPYSTAVWRMRSGLLCVPLGPWLLWITAKDARRLKGRSGDNVTPRWATISTVLSNSFALTEVELRGLQRRVTVSAEESTNVARDVDAIQAGIADQFQVHEAKVRPLVSASDVETRVEFSASLATAEGGRAALADLTRAAFQLLGQSRPIDTNQLNILLGQEL